MLHSVSHQEILSRSSTRRVQPATSSLQFMSNPSCRLKSTACACIGAIARPIADNGLLPSPFFPLSISRGLTVVRDCRASFARWCVLRTLARAHAARPQSTENRERMHPHFVHARVLGACMQAVPHLKEICVDMSTAVDSFMRSCSVCYWIHPQIPCPSFSFSR